MRRVVIIGGDAAGMSAAAQATRGADRPELVVFERGQHTSYAACGLPYFVGGVVTDADQLVARSPQQHRDNGIDVRLDHEVIAIDTARQEVTVRSLLDNLVTREPYDQLLIAVGASPIRPPLPNLDARGITGIHTIPDAVALDELIRDRAPRRGVVVGGGYIGMEMAEALLARGLEVHLVERLDQPMATLDPDMGSYVADSLRRLGIHLHLGVGVEAFEKGDDGWVTQVATTAGTLDADVVVVGLGVRPNSALARDAGIAVGPSGAIATDRRMATSAPNVYAAGDCAESFHRVSRRPVSIALGTHANKQGRVVGINLSGGDAAFPGVIGTAVTKIAEIEIGRTGLNEREAHEAGFVTTSAIIEAPSRAHYYPGADAMTVKVVAERSTGRLLGAQIVGRAGAAKRIDTFAVAVWNEMTVDELSQVDLGYAPPFSPVWDPTLVAARRAGDLRHR